MLNDAKSGDLHNGEDLEEVVLGEILVRVVRVESPKVVDDEVEDAQNEDQHHSAPLGLESHNDHDASNEAKDADSDPPEAPVTLEYEANEQEYQENAAGQLEVHPLVLLIDLRKACGGKPLPDPRIRQYHEQSSHDGQVAEEEVQVEDQTITNALQDDDTDKSENAVV